ncbi:MAG: energy transducer TonB [Pyrinomonadaceae bacterium]
MFNQLIESGSHRTDLARRGTFFAGTLVCYSLLLITTGVASVYTYNAQLDTQNLELVTLLSPIPMPPDTGVRPDEPRPASGGHRENVIERTILIARLDSNTTPPDNISVHPNTVPEIPKFGTVMLSNRNSGDELLSGGPVGPPGPDHVMSSNQPRVVVDEGVDVAPPVRPTPAPTPVPERIRVSSLILSGKVISKPVPAYPIIAKQARISGVVTVEILLDERGNVISAQATSGHPLLREAARAAAMQARFSPTLLSGQPVKVSGIITYNFVLQ